MGGGRSYEDLKKFAEENLGPTCGPGENLELCDAETKPKMEAYAKMSAGKLEGRIRNFIKNYEVELPLLKKVLAWKKTEGGKSELKALAPSHGVLHRRQAKTAEAAHLGESSGLLARMPALRSCSRPAAHAAASRSCVLAQSCLHRRVTLYVSRAPGGRFLRRPWLSADLRPTSRLGAGARRRSAGGIGWWHCASMRPGGARRIYRPRPLRVHAL